MDDPQNLRPVRHKQGRAAIPRDTVGIFAHAFGDVAAEVEDVARNGIHRPFQDLPVAEANARYPRFRAERNGLPVRCPLQPVLGFRQRNDAFAFGRLIGEGGHVRRFRQFLGGRT